MDGLTELRELHLVGFGVRAALPPRMLSGGWRAYSACEHILSNSSVETYLSDLIGGICTASIFRNLIRARKLLFFTDILYTGFHTGVKTQLLEKQGHTSQNHFCSVFFFAVSENARERDRDDVAWRHLQSGLKSLVLTFRVLDAMLDDCRKNPEEVHREGNEGNTVNKNAVNVVQNLALIVIDSIGAALAFTAWGYSEGGRRIQDEIIAMLRYMTHRGCAIVTTNHFVYWRGKPSPSLGKRWIQAVDFRYLLFKLSGSNCYIQLINSKYFKVHYL
ncbi:hypothetical protein LOAG_15153 [Loa loa]|uniref:RecA family profile 1 domain-containing protein n=1 Tax=Loa loa TaxID=7209 RepID=A0A1S0TGB6_LOALO|nr:hypothetical protein LOAG_15153 [Loa loa]EFO13375.1 hypothetical protein LOAG_15153 [Loa loa]